MAAGRPSKRRGQPYGGAARGAAALGLIAGKSSPRNLPATLPQFLEAILWAGALSFTTMAMKRVGSAMKRVSAAVCLAALLAVGGPLAAAPAKRDRALEAELLAHIKVLASDEFAGR